MAETIDRHLVVLPRGEGEIYLSWRLLSTDAADEPFHVERGQAGQWVPATSSAVRDSTGFSDRTSDFGVYDYRVVDGKGRPPETVSVDSGKEPSNLAIEFPLRYAPDQFPTRIATGDLLNDGRFGFVIVESENGTIQVCAYGQDGHHLWHTDAGLPSNGAWDGRTWHVPVVILDVDRDGRTEVVFHRGPGGEFEDNRYAQAGPDETLICVDGETGDIKWEVPWLATNARVMMTAGSLNGEDAPLSVVVLDGTYRDVRLISHRGATGEIEWQVNQARGGSQSRYRLTSMVMDGWKWSVGVSATTPTDPSGGKPSRLVIRTSPSRRTFCPIGRGSRSCIWWRRIIRGRIWSTRMGRRSGRSRSGTRIGRGSGDTRVRATG